jgi:hypothetical protein
MGDLREEIARLRSLTPELNAATDRATKLVVAVERFLNDECQFGISASVDFNFCEPDDGSPFRYGDRMEYARWEGKFRIIASNFRAPANGDEEIDERVPWVMATRDRKLSTINGIPKLLDAIHRRVRMTIRDAHQNAGMVEAYLKELGVVAKEGR